MPNGKTRKPVICVDLDGTIAKYDRWRGYKHIGEPIAGAREFLQELHKDYHIIIYTTRTNPGINAPSAAEVTDSGFTSTKKYLVQIVATWLRDNSMSFDEVYMGDGKPMCSAFVDDRAIACQPQEFDVSQAAYDIALQQIRKLVPIKQ